MILIRELQKLVIAKYHICAISQIKYKFPIYVNKKKHLIVTNIQLRYLIHKQKKHTKHIQNMNLYRRCLAV